jgi:uncharacterized protein (UPF0335 family)
MARAKKNDEAKRIDVGANSGAVLLGHIERIEELTGRKAECAEDISEVYTVAKRAGFDGKVIREIIKRRKQDQADLDEFEALLDTYMRAIQTKALE